MRILVSNGSAGRLAASLSFTIAAALLAPPAHADRMVLWSIVHGLGLLLIDGQIAPAGDLDEVISRVLRLAGAGLDREAGEKR